MPELPEVEIIVRELKRKIKGRAIKDVSVFYRKAVFPDTQKFKEKLLGSRIKNIKRRGKLIIIELNNGLYLLVHLKLTGQLVFNQGRQKHTHVIFKINDDFLNYNDVRKFGFLYVVDQEELDLIIGKRFAFGPEPFNDDFTLTYLKETIIQRKAPIKALLLDQKIVAGLGNIYTDEILFLAGIHPQRPGKDLSGREIALLHDGIIKVLRLAIKKGGSSSRDYVRTSGKFGKFHTLHNVYRKAGHVCPNCESKITRLVVAGRGTYVCPRCQVL